MPKRVRCLLVLFGLLFVLYVGSYYVLSRRGYAEADRYNMGKCFYYFTPENTDSWRFRNYTCVDLFSPLNAVDRALGFGRYPAGEPLWGLSR